MPLTEISSFQNQFVKLAKSLQLKKKRNESSLCLLEGKTLITEAINKSIVLQMLFISDEAVLKHIPNLSKDTEIFLVSPEIMAAISSTESAAPLVAIAKQRDLSKQQASQTNRFLYLEDIKDPGNLGSIIRTAFAAGVEKIFLSEHCADLYNPKTLRASMGIIFYGPIERLPLAEIASKYNLVAASGGDAFLTKTIPATDFKFEQNILLALGNESHGLSQETLDLAERIVRIDMANDVESINVLAAAAILLFKNEIRSNHSS